VLDRGEPATLALGGGEWLLELALQRPRDEPVLWLARVELAAGPLGLILRSLEREPLTGDPPLVLLLELADRARGRGHARRAHRLQERGDEGLLERPPPSDWQLLAVW